MWRRMLMTLGIISIACDRTPGPIPATSSDSVARSKLLDHIGDINDFDRPRPLVSLATFFEGNHDFGSIGYNLPNSPSPQEWYHQLQAIAERPEVFDVRVEVVDLEDPEGWPSTDTVWIITTATPDDVSSLLSKRIEPTEILEGFGSSLRPVEPYDLPADHNALGLWYD